MNDTKTAETPLTDAMLLQPRHIWNYSSADERYVEADECRKIELALAASKSREEAQALREAELAKALELAYQFTCGFSGKRVDKINKMLRKALTAPPTNSKEMNK